MESKRYEYETKRLDHLGIVAGICKQLKLIEIIDEAMIVPSNRKVSSGQAVQAMVLNALGLSGRALYLMPEYLENKPVDMLIGEGLVASDFNDDTLGRALDEVQQAGVTELFARVASSAVEVFEIETKYAHLDTSSFSLHGNYESEGVQKAVETYGAVEVRHGHSKANRPELKQVVVTLITSQASALPLWLEVLDGNSSDKKSFRKTVQSYTRQLEGETTPWFIMDSAGYTQENLETWQETKWVARVPETITQAKELIQAVATEAMTDAGNGYRVLPMCNRYAGIRQRWLLVYSEQAYERESKSLDKRVVRAATKAQKEWRTLQQTLFQCEVDAKNALNQLNKCLLWHQVQAQIVPVKKYAKAGRPAKDAVAKVVGWQVTGTLATKQQAIEDSRQWLGRFIVATNLLDETELPDKSLLNCYKEQSSAVERGFRFLKDPMFFADSLFLKSPVRIMAMIMIMGLALLVYALAERELRRQLAASGETIPDQKGLPTQTPTMRRVAQIFEGVDILLVRIDEHIIERRIINLTPLRRTIIRLFGPHIENYYLVDY